MIKTRFLLAFCLLSSFSAMAQPVGTAAPGRERRLRADTYVYSDFCIDASGFDARGHRLVLGLGPVLGNETISLEFSEFGADRGPLRSYRVNFEDAINRQDNINHLEFSYQTQIDEYTFTGTVSVNGDRLTGIFDDDNRPVTLMRVPTNAPARPICAD